MGGGSVGEVKWDSGEGMMWRMRTELGRIKQMEGAKSKIDIHYFDKFNEGPQRGVTWYEVKKHPGRLLVDCTKFVRWMYDCRNLEHLISQFVIIIWDVTL